MGALIRMPLWVLLPCLAVSFVAFGAVAAGLAGVSGASGYVLRQADNNLLACASSMLSHGFVAPPGSSQVPPVPCGMELLSASGQVLTVAASGTAYGPAIPAGGAWLAAHLARPVTVPGAGTSGRWRVVIEAVRYQPQRVLYVYGGGHRARAAGLRGARPDPGHLAATSQGCRVRGKRRTSRRRGTLAWDATPRPVGGHRREPLAARHDAHENAGAAMRESRG
jgi:hypothetical protein